MVRGAVKGEPRELLGVEAVGAVLRRVAADRQGAGQRLGLEAVAEAGHVAVAAWLLSRIADPASQPMTVALATYLLERRMIGCR